MTFDVAALRMAEIEPSPRTGLSGQESMENQLDMLKMMAEVAPRYSSLLSHSPYTCHSSRALTWVVLETHDKMLEPEQPCPMGVTGRKKSTT